MGEQQIRVKLAGVAGSLRDLGVKSLLLFGSAATGEATATSDLDFLVEFEGMATFDRYMSLKELLECELQAPIDLVTNRAQKPLFREQILAEAINVA